MALSLVLVLSVAAVVDTLTLHVAVMFWNQTGEVLATNHSLGCATLAESDLRVAGLMPDEVQFVYHTFNSKYPDVCLLHRRGGIVATVDFYYNHNVSGFIGPFCSSEMITAALLAKTWNLPIVRFQATSHELKDKSVFATLAGMNPADSAEFANAHLLLLNKWNYTRIALLYCDYIAVTIRMQGIRGALNKNSINITNEIVMQDGITYEEIVAEDFLKQVQENTRVILISMGRPIGNNIRLLKALAAKNMTAKHGYLIFMNQVTPGFPLDPWNDPDVLEYGGVTAEEAMHLFSFTFTLELKDVTAKSMQAFFERVHQHAGSSPNTPVYLIDFFSFLHQTEQFHILEDSKGMVMPVYDAFYLYGQALGRHLMEHGVSWSNARNGREIWNRMRNTKFNGSIGVTFTDMWADKVNAFTLYFNLNETSGLTPVPVSHLIPVPDPVCQQLQTQPGPEAKSCYNLKETELLSHFWPFDDGHLPENRPICGYKQERCPNMQEESMGIYVFIVTLCSVIITVLGYFAYRKKKERDLNRMPWHILRSRVHFQNSDRVGAALNTIEAQAATQMTLDAVSTMEELPSGVHSNVNGEWMMVADGGDDEHGCYAHALVDSCLTTVVATRQIADILFDSDQLTLLNDIWRCNHDNLGRFIGLCFNEKREFLIIWRLSPRGNLQDILFNEDIHLDDNFKSSFMRDIAKGLNYLHQSNIKVHGQLNTQTCLVESHWVVKLSEFGLNNLLYSMREQEQLKGPPPKTIQELYHLAPEILEQERLDGFHEATPEADIYSLGIILYQILYRLQPYVDLFIPAEEILDQLAMERDVVVRPILPQEPKYNSDVITIVKACWLQDPVNRPPIKTVKQCLNQAFSTYAGTVVEHLMAMMESYATNLEKLVRDRTLQLVEAQQRADALLAQLLPKSVVEDLKAGKRVTPQMYSEATILFSDIVEFTSLCSQSTPLQIVTFLNDLYSNFDALIEQLHAYKVETVGDAYMVVSGIPEEIGGEHVFEIANLALAMRDASQSFTLPHIPEYKLAIRIGFHSGPVATGVVGIASPRYCLFGDTVNMASRMESTSEAMKIQISETSSDLLRERQQYHMVERGKITVKGKGQCLTFWLLDKMSQ